MLGYCAVMLYPDPPWIALLNPGEDMMLPVKLSDHRLLLLTFAVALLSKSWNFEQGCGSE